MRILLCMLLLGCLAVESADAQRRRDRDRDRREWWDDRGPVRFGVRGGYDFEEDVGSAGTQLRVPLLRQLLLVPSGDVFFEDAATEWQVNADLVVMPDEFGGLYLGAGAAFVRRDFDADGGSETETGYNLIAGLDGGALFHTRVQPFVEARWSDVDEYDPFRLLVGINVPVY